MHRYAIAERSTEITNRAESDDGTQALLRTGIWMLAAGAAAALLAATVFGGISRQHPDTGAQQRSCPVVAFSPIRDFRSPLRDCVSMHHPAWCSAATSITRTTTPVTET